MSERLQGDVGGLLWYAECMDRALKEVRAFTPPAADVRFHHSLFVVNLMSLLERSAELFGEGVFTEWAARLEGTGGHSGPNNAGYVRELRNAVVHRGVDITSSGITVEDHVLAVALPEISDRLGRRGPFKAFAYTLLEIFEICRAIAGPLVLEFAEPTFAQINEMPVEQQRADYLRGIEAASPMPDWAKKLARQSVDQIPFDVMRTHQSDKLRTLLS